MRHQIEVSRVVSASPERVYELVSDLPRMGEWSPENTGGKWVKGATGPAVGALFEGTNRLGKKKWKYRIFLRIVIIAEIKSTIRRK